MSVTAMAIFIGLVLLLIVGAVIFGFRQKEGDSIEIVRFIAVGSLSAIALFCIFGLLYLSTPPAAVAALANDKNGTSQSILGLGGQIISILGTIGAAAVGGIAGLLMPSPQRRGSGDRGPDDRGSEDGM
jgi:Na+/serine symporter